MELYCPKCEKKLIVDDEFAGQDMKCPMCQESFTAPALPSYSTSAPRTQPQPPPEPPSEKPPSTAAPKTSAPAPAASAERSFPIDPKYLQWGPAGALFLLLILTFCTWIWIGYSGFTIYTQSGWQSAFGLRSGDAEGYKEVLPGALQDLVSSSSGFSFFLILYLLLLLCTLFLAIVVAAVAFLPFPMPPIVQKLLPWKWAFVAGLLLLGFVLLSMQQTFGFALPNTLRGLADKRYAIRTQKETDKALLDKAALNRGMARDSIHFTTPLTMVFWIHLLALVSCGALFWMDYRRKQDGGT